MRKPGLDRSGFAIVAVLLVGLALCAIAQGALAIARREVAASVLEERLIGRRLVARAAAATSLPDSLPPIGPTPTVVRSGATPPVSWRSELQRLDREMLLVVGVAEREGLPGADRAARLAWTADPSTRVAASTGVIEAAGGVLREGAVSVRTLRDRTVPGVSTDCRAELAALDSLGLEALPAVAPLSDPTRRGVPSFGLIPGDTLLARALALPPPPTDAACLVSDPACRPFPTVIASDGPLVLSGTVAHGVVVVRAGLVLQDGARLIGLAFVGGDLSIEAGSALVGLAKLGGVARLADGASVLASACAAASVIRSAPALGRPILLPGTFPLF